MLKKKEQKQQSDREKYKSVKFSLASPITRILAYSIDFSLRSLLLLLLLLIFIFPNHSFLQLLFFLKTVVQLEHSPLKLLVYFTTFLLFSFLYHFLFEAIWYGQTPGKRLLNIRIIEEEGEVLQVHHAFLRNILRAADWLPCFYLIGTIQMYLNKHHKRIGDQVARTIVVSEERLPVLLPFQHLKLTDAVSSLEVTDRIKISSSEKTKEQIVLFHSSKNLKQK